MGRAQDTLSSAPEPSPPHVPSPHPHPPAPWPGRERTVPRGQAGPLSAGQTYLRAHHPRGPRRAGLALEALRGERAVRRLEEGRSTLPAAAESTRRGAESPAGRPAALRPGRGAGTTHHFSSLARVARQPVLPGGALEGVCVRDSAGGDGRSQGPSGQRAEGSSPAVLWGQETRWGPEARGGPRDRAG